MRSHGGDGDGGVVGLKIVEWGVVVNYWTTHLPFII